MYTLYKEDEDEEPRRKRPDRGWLKRRQERDPFEGIFKELRAELDLSSVKKFVHIDDATFSRLVDCFATNYNKEGHQNGVLISPEERVALTVRYLATGERHSEAWLNWDTCSGYKKSQF